MSKPAVSAHQRKTNHSQETKYWAYVIWKANGENAYRASKETGINESTIRSWVKVWRTEGIPEEANDIIAEIATDHTGRLAQVRDKALERLLQVIPDATEKQIGSLATVVGIMEDKIRLVAGLPTSRSETTQRNALPSKEQMKEFVDQLVEASNTRTAEIVDADIEIIGEQAKKALPEGA